MDGNMFSRQSYEVNMQRAILSSIQSAAPPRQAPSARVSVARQSSSITRTFAPRDAGRSSNGRGLVAASPVRRPTNRNLATNPASGPSTKTLGSTNRAGKVNALQREGLIPAQTAGSGRLESGSSTSHSNKNRSVDVTPAANPHAGVPKGSNWVRKLGRGTLSTAAAAVLVVDNNYSSQTIFMHSNKESGNSAASQAIVSCELLVHRAGTGDVGRVGFVFDYNSSTPVHAVTCHLLPNNNEWQIVRSRNGKDDVIAVQGDRSSRIGSRIAVKAIWQKSQRAQGQFDLTLTVNGNTVFRNVAISGVIEGKNGFNTEIGIECRRCHAEIHGWGDDAARCSESTINSSQAPSSSIKMVAPAKPATVSVSAAKSNGDKHMPESVQSVGNQAKEPFREGDSKFIDLIEQDILLDKSRLGVEWDSIASLDDPKRLLKEAVVLPLLMPDLFTGIREPWKGVLLFGPPGTGKTMLAKAVASQAGTTFFNVSAATLVSKYHGESEKMVKTLFAMARHYAPSVIFFDEIDSIMTQRASGGGEHEASRRLKTELLSQMDGLPTSSSAPNGCDGLVMVLATTNTPWDLDEALRRRLEKRVFVPLPDMDARKQALELHLSTVQLNKDVDLSTISSKTEGFSGADLKTLCREASMQPMRRAMSDHSPEEMMQLRSQGQLALQVCQKDFYDALERTQPTADTASSQRYSEWARRFGSA